MPTQAEINTSLSIFFLIAVPLPSVNKTWTGLIRRKKHQSAKRRADKKLLKKQFIKGFPLLKHKSSSLSRIKTGEKLGENNLELFLNCLNITVLLFFQSQYEEQLVALTVCSSSKGVHTIALQKVSNSLVVTSRLN